MSRFRGSGARVPDAQRAERGQVVVIFAISIFVFVGLCAIALDLSWYWANTLRMQRAADAAALAGVVHLPGDPSTAASVARAEAAKNGYVDGVAGVTISAVQDPSNPRRLKVHLASPVGTFFSRVFGMDAFPRRDSRSEFVLPVPMGSPDAWYGVFGKLRHPGGGITTTTSTAGTTSLFASTAVPSVNWSKSRQRRCESEHELCREQHRRRLEPALVVVRTAGHGGRSILGHEHRRDRGRSRLPCSPGPARRSPAVGCLPT